MSRVYTDLFASQTRSKTGNSKPRVFESAAPAPAPTKKTVKKPAVAKPKKAPAAKKPTIKKTVAGKVTKAKKEIKKAAAKPAAKANGTKKVSLISDLIHSMLT